MTAAAMATRLARAAAQCATRAGSHLTASTSAACAVRPSYAAIHAWNACFVRHDSNAASLPLISRNLMLDTLDLMRRFERLGMTRKQAEDLTQTLTEVLCTNREKLAECYVPKSALEKSLLEQDSRIAGLRSEVLRSQELQVATFLRDTERLQSNLEKIRSEIRYEVDKLTASQRLDLNLEKGRMRDELQMLRDKANELEIQLDKEVNALRAAMEQSKNDTVKYVLGLMLALLTAGLGAARLVLH